MLTYLNKVKPLMPILVLLPIMCVCLSFPKLFRIENLLNIKKVMGRIVWMCFVLTASAYIELNALEIITPCVNSVNI